MFALKDQSDSRRQPSQHLIGGIDDMPLGRDLAGLCQIRAHRKTILKTPVRQTNAVRERGKQFSRDGGHVKRSAGAHVVPE
jgi:hypothetical protein